MSQSGQPAPISCFGKLPSRGDFVKTSNNPQLLSVLDSWVSRTMELVSEAAHWKRLYDAMPPVDFAFLGTRSRLVIGGHLRPSQDASERRFPFLAVAPFEVDQPVEFIAHSPLALTRVWQRLGVAATEMMNARDPSELLQIANTSHVTVDAQVGSYSPIYKDFCEIQTVSSIESLLQAAGHQSSVRYIVLALGVLLQPVMASGATHLDKGLRLPLPADAIYRPLVASFWLDLIVRFLRQTEYELLLMLESRAERPSLLVCFSGASPESLHGLIDPAVDAQRNIFLDDPDWVSAHVGADYGMTKLDSYLMQPELSLLSVIQTFQEVFVGG